MNKRKRWILTGRCFSIGLLCMGLLGTRTLYGNEVTASVDLQTTVLKNGLTVITKANHAIPVVSVFVWYRTGARNEPLGESGAAHFLEHLLFKGSKQFPNGESTRLVERTGGHQNAFTSQDYTAFYETLPAEHLELALRIEADRMQNAILLAKDVEQERTVILSELDGNMNHPEVRLRNLTNAQTWLCHPYRRPVIGWREEVARLSLKQIRDFYRAYYTPRHAVLVVAGDFDPNRLRAWLDKYFAVIPGQREAGQFTLPLETQSGERRAVLKDHGPAAMVQINIQVPPAGHEDHYALSILNDVLTRGRSARLYKALVDTGLAVHISSGVYEMIDPGEWSFQAQCQQGVPPEKIEAVIRQEFKKIQDEVVGSREFEKCVNQTRAQLVFSHDSLTEQAMMLGFYQTVAGNYRLFEEYPQKIAQVTPGRLQAAARKYLNPDLFTIGFFVPAEGASGGAAPSEPAVSSPGHGKPVFSSQAWHSQDLAAGQAAGQAAGSAKGREEVQRFVLENGLTLLVQHNPGNPMIALSGLVKGGISREPKDFPGIAIFHAQMLDRGTKKRTAAELAEAMEFKGANLDFAARAEEMVFSGEALSEDMDLVLSTLAECLMEPTFPTEEMERVRKQLLSQCTVARESSDVRAWQGFFEMAYPEGHPLRRNLAGSEDGIRSLTQNGLIRYQAEAMAPEAVILSISGDMEPTAVREQVEKYLGPWRPGHQGVPRSPEPLLAMAEVQTSKTQTITLKGKSESIVVLGHEGLHRLDPDYYKALVANQVLGGGGFLSLLMKEVRERAGLTYSIYSQFKPSAGIRPWCLVFQSDPGQVKEAVDLALKQVERLQQGQVPKQMFQDACEQLVGSLALNMESNVGMAQLNREIEYYGLGPNYREKYAQGVRSVTYQDMVAAARKWFHPDRRLLSIAEPAPQAQGVSNGK